MTNTSRDKTDWYNEQIDKFYKEYGRYPYLSEFASYCNKKRQRIDQLKHKLKVSLPKKSETKIEQFRDFYHRFKNDHGRYPSIDEISNNFPDKNDLTRIKSYIKNNELPIYTKKQQKIDRFHEKHEEFFNKFGRKPTKQEFINYLGIYPTSLYRYLKYLNVSFSVSNRKNDYEGSVV